MSVRAMKAGAVDFLSKPFRDQDMIDAVTAAINRDRLQRASEQQASAIVDRYLHVPTRARGDGANDRGQDEQADCG